jgi:hypothetical protein
VKRRHFQPVFKQGRHDGIHFVLQQDEVAHHDVHAAIAFGDGDPAAESKRSRGGDSVNADL